MELLKLVDRDCVTTQIHVDPVFEQHGECTGRHRHHVIDQNTNNNEIERFFAMKPTRQHTNDKKIKKNLNKSVVDKNSTDKEKKINNDIDYSIIRVNSFLYAACVRQDPSIELMSDFAHVNQRIEALRDLVVHGVLHDVDMCETYSLKPRTRKLQEFVQAVATANLDDVMPTAFVDYLASHILKVHMVTISVGKAGSMASMWSNFCVQASNSTVTTRECMVYCKGDGWYAVSSDLRASMALYSKVLSYDVAQISRHKPFEKVVIDDVDEGTLTKWCDTVLKAFIIMQQLDEKGLDTLVLDLKAALAESTAPKRSRAKKTMEERRTVLATCLVACVGHLLNSSIV